MSEMLSIRVVETVCFVYEITQIIIVTQALNRNYYYFRRNEKRMT